MEKTEKESAIKKFVASVKSPARGAHSRVGSGFSLSEIKAAGKTVMLLKELNIKIDYFRNTSHEWNIQQLKTLKPPKKKESDKEPYLSKEERIKARRKVKKKVRPPKEKELIPEIDEDIFYEADEIKAKPDKTVAKSKKAPKPKPVAKAKPTAAIKAKTPKPPKVKPKPAIKTKPKPTIKAKTPEPPKTKVKPVVKAKPKPAIKTKTPKPPKTKVKPAAKAKPEKVPVAKEEPTGLPLNKLSGLGAATSKKFIELGVKTVEDLVEEDADELAMLISGVSADRIKKWMQEGTELLEK